MVKRFLLIVALCAGSILFISEKTRYILLRHYLGLIGPRPSRSYTGDWINWTKDGAFRSYSQYSNGLLDGFHVVSQEGIFSLVTYIDGEAVGDQITIDENGRLISYSHVLKGEVYPDRQISLLKSGKYSIELFDDSGITSDYVYDPDGKSILLFNEDAFEYEHINDEYMNNRIPTFIDNLLELKNQLEDKVYKVVGGL